MNSFDPVIKQINLFQKTKKNKKRKERKKERKE